MKILKKEVYDEAVDHILPFWMKMKDEEYGGFYSFMNNDLLLDQRGDKGAIAIARFLWSFSAAYRAFDKAEYLAYANHSYQYLIKHMVDQEHGGLYWMTDYKGKVVDSRKHIYTQSFGIYSLSEYYRVTGNREALELAISLFNLIEEKGFCHAEGMYSEEFTREWKASANEMLSENDVIAEGTTNTHLHILEAYTNLYRVWKDPSVEKALRKITGIFYQHIYKQEARELKVFYDRKWNEILDLKSYGHDIEASWLIDEALKVLGEKTPEYKKMVEDIANQVLKCAFLENGIIIPESQDGERLEKVVWWIQAEAMVGFTNMYQLKNDASYMDVTKQIWSYTKEHMIDHRENGEWFQEITFEGEPLDEKPMVEPWKTPYHNLRFCIELIERIQ